ncbi:MAG: efflux transporter, family, subunit [Bacteroidetes bacterium]|nr:efflux transporter, family, subunit [Bacteroidota bacterium]
MTKYTLFSIGLALTSFGFLSACHQGKTTETRQKEILPENIVELREDQAKLANIETGAIELRSLSGTIKVSGIITVPPQNQATVCMPMGGFVKSTFLLPGDAVRKGQTLAILENPEFVDVQQNYLEAKNRLEFAEAEFRRHNELFKDDVYSQKNLEQVTADYKTLKAQVKALEQKLALIGIPTSDLNEDNISSSVPVGSPVSGYLKTVNVNTGKYVAPSDIMFEIVSREKILLELTLFEKDADKVTAGQKIHFFINNEAEQHEAVIYQTGKSINNDRTFTVYASALGSCKNVLPGMYVNAIIETSDKKVNALPSDAIVSFDDKQYIFVFNRNKEEEGKPFTEFRMIEVKKGISDAEYTEVILPDGFDIKTAQVVIKGAYNLLSAKKNAGEMAC